MPPDRTLAPRQEPVSCQLCRQRKLKCSRHYPCSNCHARGVQCNYKTPATLQLESPNPAPTTMSDLVAENVDIKSRLTRLERLLSGRLGALRAESDDDERSTQPLVDIIQATARSAGPSPQRRRKDTSKPETGPRLQIVPVSELMKCFADTENSSAYIPFPPLDKGMKLLEQYTDFLHAMLPILHCPSMKKTLAAIYSNASQPIAQAEISDLALILVIFASVAFYCHVDIAPHGCFPSKSEALLVACKWAKIAINFIWPPRSEHTTMQALQAIVIYYFLVHHMEGVSPYVRIMHANTVTIARDLGLHKIDSVEHTNLTRKEIIDHEIGRRVWWHICGSDWQLAHLPGPIEGTYIIHPRHCKVKLPRNVTDEDLLNENADFTRPPNEPTPVAYFLQRTRISEICRMVVDTCFDGPRAPEPWEQDYQMVLYTDNLYEKMLQDVPSFLLFTDDGKPQMAHLDDQYPYLRFIRQITNIMIHTRRFKLHLPYIGLSSQTEQYSYSAQICLRSARHILQMQDTLKLGSASDPGSGMRINAILRHLLHGLVLTIMGLRDDVEHGGPARGPRPHNPIRDADEVLTGLDEHNKSANTFLDSLKAMLDEHEARLTPPGRRPVVVAGAQDAVLTPDSTQWVDPNLGLDLASFDFDIAWDQFLS